MTAGCLSASSSAASAPASEPKATSDLPLGTAVSSAIGVASPWPSAMRMPGGSGAT
jgi:hypothetical protein